LADSGHEALRLVLMTRTGPASPARLPVYPLRDEGIVGTGVGGGDELFSSSSSGLTRGSRERCFGTVGWLAEGERVPVAHPPLSCRTSPPQGGRSAEWLAALSIERSERCLRWRRSWGGKAAPRCDLPLEGEMPGRAERGGTARQTSIHPPAFRRAPMVLSLPPPNVPERNP
jgi:hypothetical protein